MFFDAIFEKNITLIFTTLRYAVTRFLPFAASSTAAFVGNSPKGRGREAARRQMGRKPILPSPDKCKERKT